MKSLAFVGAGLVVAGVIVAIVLMTGGPGGNSLAQAAENMRDQNVRMVLDLGFSEGGEDVSMTGNAISTADGGRMKMDLKMSDSSGEATDMTIVMIRDDSWYTSPDFEGVLPEGKRWVHEIDRETAPTTMTMGEFADFLARADEVENTGETKVDGVLVDHYRGRVNVREVAEETGGETAKRFEELLGDRDILIPMEAWIGKDGLPVQMSMNIDSGDGSMSMTAKQLEYGVKVDVQPPPKAETIEDDEFEELTAG